MESQFVDRLRSDLFVSEMELNSTKLAKLDLEKEFEKSYCPETHLSALEEIIFETQKVMSFNLVLCVLLNEVNSKLDIYSALDNAGRVNLNRELKMCLLREINRCKQEAGLHKLPIFSKRFEILGTMKDHDAMILLTDTGSGKSTQVPQFLADDLHHILLSSNPKKFPRVVCT